MCKYVLQLKHYIFLIINGLGINADDLISEIFKEEKLLEKWIDIASGC